MAIQCRNCGKTLPRDDARFCNNCGTLVPDHPFSLQSLAATKGSPPLPSTDQPDNKKSQPGSSKPPLREQIAQQPPATPRRPRHSNASRWVSELDTLEHGKLVPEKTAGKWQERAPEEEAKGQDQPPRELSPAGGEDKGRQELAPDVDSLVETPTISSPSVPAAQPLQSPEVEPSAKKEDVPAPVAEEADTQWEAKVQMSPERVLRVKVWDQGEPIPAAQDARKAASDDSVEDLPTGPLTVENSEPGVQRDALPPPILGVQTSHFEEVTDLDTLPLLAPQQVRFAPEPVERQAMQGYPQPGDRAAAHGAMNRQNYASTPPAGQPALRAAWETPGSTPVLPPQEQVWSQRAPIPAQARRSKRRVPALVTLVLICLLVAAGVAVWILKFQPFSIPQVTQPQQQFQSSALGFSLLYPNGWSVQVDRKSGTAHFADSSHTAQFSVVVVPANGQDAGQYLLKQAMQLGLTGSKPGPSLTFAGSTWQQAQGNVQQAGANYAETLLVTTHGSNLVLLIQQAPQVTYAEEEQAVFAGMRSSFQFLS